MVLLPTPIPRPPRPLYLPPREDHPRPDEARGLSADDMTISIQKAPPPEAGDPPLQHHHDGRDFDAQHDPAPVNHVPLSSSPFPEGLVAVGDFTLGCHLSRGLTSEIRDRGTADTDNKGETAPTSLIAHNFYGYEVIPFGIHNASSAFRRLLERVETTEGPKGATLPLPTASDVHPPARQTMEEEEVEVITRPTSSLEVQPTPRQVLLFLSTTLFNGLFRWCHGF